MTIVARYAYQGTPVYAIRTEHGVYRLAGDLFGEYQAGERLGGVDDSHLLAPVQPSKIVAIGRNYVEHAREQKAPVPSEPLLFLKPPSALLAPGGTILIPPQSAQVDHEAELAVVIGRRTRQITPDQATAVILGYTCANDVTARDLQNKDGQWTRSKGFDTFCPVGPWIVTGLDPSHPAIRCRVNGQVRQSGNTRDMVFNVPVLVSYISAVMTLEPGDLILTGTPSGISPLHPGDQVEVEVEGIGVLRNTVQSASQG